jgi:hypothetical protein
MAPSTIVTIKGRIRRARAVLYSESSSLLIAVAADVIQPRKNFVDKVIKGLSK